MDALLKDTSARMERSIEAFRKELGKVRTGRASFSLLDGIKVDYYGTPTPLQQVGTLSVPESRMITVTPWDTKMIGPIEKAVQGSGLGLNPASDGKMVRIPIPPLTEERRKELAKMVRKMAEDARVAVRNVRREAIEKLKDREKKKEISEDLVKRGQERIQKETDAHVKKVDEILKSKEQEILEV
ncbi:MAG TPA: ribosome recycling factor [Deltaproteobacteria bacterium]|nr:MAG: ribosome recycling factor [Deltaproteobacteria bacterium GWA2_65_63]OGP28733.1 MAG: ribosome recycling factor [Deltaproteobacteria bacterium GWB2_65_81]OGP37188.1 MAG: ribosome recycling factor [Deltaproteobacteria bacterium GWC2_66_88]OGP78835.1 MAG: ribosome recycling factor [Deltaproteobacteria bacterium RBG_16_66_15]HAM31975.1 ribosome recycling factor [Deltaproteobacteria bacterium]